MGKFAHFKKNLIPGVMLWIFAISLVLAYYQIPQVKYFFDQVGEFKTRVGITYSVISTMIFGAIIPFLYLKFTRGADRSLLIFFLIYWGYKGAEVDLLYRAQAYVFGSNADFWVTIKKVFIDQFIFTPFWSSPSAYFIYKWKELNFSFKKLRPYFSKTFFIKLLPNILISTWIVWVPAVTVIYSFPTALQIPLFNLVLCFWSLVLELLLREKPQA
jgi:hypothetical protein